MCSIVDFTYLFTGNELNLRNQKPSREKPILCVNNIFDCFPKQNTKKINHDLYNYWIGIFRFLKINHNFSFLKTFEKITKNVISRKLQRIEQSYLEARFAILEITLTGPNYRAGISDFTEKKLISFLKFFFEKSQKTSYLENHRDLNCHIWRQDL